MKRTTGRADEMGLGKSLQALGLILTNGPKSVDEPKTTLIVCPLSVMTIWEKQVERHVIPNTLRVGLYHGPDRFNLLPKLSDFDILVTSYGTMASDFLNDSPNENHRIMENQPPKKKTAKFETSIFDILFRRIILDEAHIIRNVKSTTYAGCMALQAKYRLCLTGTPLQNKPEDIHSLLSFLSVEPFADRPIFKEAIAQPIYFGNAIGLSRLRTVMTQVALRRSKSKLDLPPKNVEFRWVTFPDNCPHKYIHDALFKSAQMDVREKLSTPGSTDIIVEKTYMEILESLLRLRQACVSGVIVPKTILLAAEDAIKPLKKDRDLQHGQDRTKWSIAKKLSVIEMKEYLGPSPKLKALVRAIFEMKDDEKGVVFSQFTKVLDLLEPFFQSLGYSYVRIDGSKSISQRNRAMQEFSVEVGGPRFMLCSLHAAGTGITLTRANHCYMMDPWWNSSVEQQAMDRVSHMFASTLLI